MQKKLLLLAGAIILLAISIKFFPYHCNCTVKQPDAAVPITALTPGVHMGASQLKIGNTTVTVDVSDTPALREKGLSGRTTLETNTGMLFIFEKLGTYGFWMKDMNFPIDIVWIDSTKQIVSCEKGLKPDSYPAVFYPKKPILYALEVPSGFCDTHKIDTGLNVSLEL